MLPVAFFLISSLFKERATGGKKYKRIEEFQGLTRNILYNIFSLL